VQGAQLFLVRHVANFRQECSRAAITKMTTLLLENSVSADWDKS
jgi:hypothetical protein